MTAYQSIREGGIEEGEIIKSQKAVKRLLLHGTLSVPEIAHVIDVPITFVIEIRDKLLSEGNTLSTLVRDFKI